MARLRNEAETRAKLVDPKLKRAGWGESHIEREHYFVKGRAFTAGRIYLVGEESRRREPRRADYVLRYGGQMIAVVEAKAEDCSAEAGLGQAKAYAQCLDVPFAYSTNGRAFVEFDFQTKKSCELNEMPSPRELWARWTAARRPAEAFVRAQRAAERKESAPRNPILYPPCPASACGKELRYFQEVAVKRVIERVLRGQKRILVAMATGTGKTFTAFQIVWKLKKSGFLRKPVLFVADRIPLRDQAFNAFGPFKDGSSDPRGVIEGGKFNPNRDLYFALYQSLDSDDGRERLFEKIPKDFFGLIIIDECHRSGFGKWNDILKHFPDAVQFGMTATPKRDESIDTYAYFCADEPEVWIDPEDRSKGKWRPPAFSYSLGQGIEDGFLATYKVHRVRTTVDRNGLRVEEAKAQGAEFYIPARAKLRESYLTPQFEREITLPDRTATMVEHLAESLRRFGPMQKTMVFCVDMEHARLTARLLQNEFADLGHAEYAVPILSEESEALAWLEAFQDSDKKTPVVATTAELLSTGVDVPSCRNIVFMKPLGSPILFKQIIGRGSRVDAATGKEWFRIIDYVGVTRLFDDWDRPPGEPPAAYDGPRTSALEGEVLDADTQALIVGASVTVLTGPNEQQGPRLTDGDGHFRFDELPAAKLRLSARGAGYRPTNVSVETAPEETQSVVVTLRPEGEPVEKIVGKNVTVTIADETTFFVQATGTHLSLAEYVDYTRANVMRQVTDTTGLREVWTDTEKRERFLEGLEAESVQPELLSEVLAEPDADGFDLLAHLAFGTPLHTRSERVEAFLNRESGFLASFKPKAREVLLALLEKYRLAGVNELASADVFRLSPFREMGLAPGVIKRFGGPDALKVAVSQLQQKLYPPE
ncbi:MAG: DEAD/DEAH box helicase family protein [Deltaproteobacteria bacterium]|nr:DEAD/DEAH box helicase family protein [Deltaproteobacteria bacterium]